MRNYLENLMNILPVLECSVTTLNGKSCPEKPTYEIKTDSGIIHLCDLCYQNTIRGYYGERLKHYALNNFVRINS